MIISTGSPMKVTMDRKCWGFTPPGVKACCRQWFCLLVVAGFLTGCASTGTSAYRNPNFDQSKSYRVAVFPFRDAPQAPGSGDALSTIFEGTLLASGGRFELVDRGEIERILREHHAGVNGMGAGVGGDRPDYVQEFEDPVGVGKLLRVDLVVVGTVTKWQDLPGRPSVAALVKAVSVEKGVVVWSLDQFTDDAPHNPVDFVASKLCRQMIATLVGKNPIALWHTKSEGAELELGSTNTLVYRNPNFDQSKSYRVAVFPFHDAPQAPGSGDRLSSIFESTLLASSGNFEVVEREETERSLRERHPDVNGMGGRCRRGSSGLSTRS